MVMKRSINNLLKSMVDSRWSMDYRLWTFLFFLISVSVSAQTITRAEYFFDSDPGVGNATSLTITPAASINQTYNLSTGSLSTGFHTFNARVRDNTGKWSLFTTRTFYLIPNPFSLSPSLNITRAEYFYDIDPGIGNGTNIPVTANPTQNLTINAPTTPLTAGFHTVNVRVRDDQGRWSLFTTRTFYLMPASVLPSNLVKLEYYVDTDPGIGQATLVNIPTAPTVNQLFSLDLPVLTPGSYTLNVRAKDSNGFWSERVSAPFAITACGAPIPSASAVSVCPGNAATLIAAGGTNGQYRWYTSATGGTPIAGQTSNTFVTPSILVATNFYVSIDDGTCESLRTTVAVTPIATVCAAPIITPTPLATQIGGLVTLNLVPFITTANNNLDINSIQVITSPTSGAQAFVNNGVLTINYAGISFSGTETFTIEACDLLGNCSQQVFTIDVVSELIIYNAVSPNGDGKNDFFLIQYIDLLPGTQNNRVTIYNRWGDVVFEVSNYNSVDRVFKGENESGKPLPSGIYFYKIEFVSDRKTSTGFLSLKH
jgi:gliding motility-associated-like protein